MCSRITVFLFNDRIKNKCPLERNSQTVPETIQCNLLDPANKMSCQWSDQEYLPWSLCGCFCPLVHTEDQGILSYRGTCWVEHRHLHDDRLAHILLGGKEKSNTITLMSCVSETAHVIDEQGREGEKAEASHKIIQKIIKIRREECFQTQSDLGTRPQQRMGDATRKAWIMGNNFNPLQNRLFKTRISVLCKSWPHEGISM